MIEASIYNKCVRCGLCLPSCPTYLETMTETSGPRGRISLIKAVDEERLDLLSPGFVHQMSECLDCRACAAVCPSGVQYGELVEGARARIEQATAQRRPALKRFLRRFLLRTLFEHGWLMRAAATLLRFAQRSGLQRLAMRSGAAKAFNLQGAWAIAPTLSQTFFAPRNQRFTGSGAVQRTVFFHTGCVMHVAFAHWHEASIRVLRRNNCTVIVPADQACCGAIAVHAGDVEFGEHLAKRNIAAFERSNADYYVVNAAGCGSALKEYAILLQRDPHWAHRAERFSARVRDILEFLDEIGVEAPTRPVEATVTYQDACHLAHAQRVTEAPRRLLQRIPGLKLREMSESAVCCGSAGIYNLTQPEMAARLGERKAKNVIESGADIVATSNPGCALQMAAHLRTLERPTPIKHVVELLDEAYAASD
ncbi:MAG TPA: (Fe-S)-binding protein [Candidatus Baltobacteraceae bacterium]|jgi:glycolate oxidase iron-sulfur subunit|nr:(Fe-S)-binding protein [Candidatus Baltobacteraceae bacterium]